MSVSKDGVTPAGKNQTPESQIVAVTPIAFFDLVKLNSRIDALKLLLDENGKKKLDQIINIMRGV